MRVEDFDYHLPEELIAQTPLENRADSRLLVVNPVTQEIIHSRFFQIQEFLRPGDILVLNNSKVLPARLYARKKDTDALVELLLLHPTANGMTWSALAKPAKRLKVGTELVFFAEGKIGSKAVGHAVVKDVMDDGLREIVFDVDEPFEQFLDRVGVMPLPPYIHATLEDRSRYQTVYAKTLGSVAAPTAGLHFTQDLLQRLRAYGVEIHFVTLHVGIGTFRSIQVENVEEHAMHHEWFELDESTAAAIRKGKLEGRRVIAVGTTALRTLESCVKDGECISQSGDTGIFIYPGYQFQIVDGLITNFHLPKSTLFMLVSAWMGIDFAKHVYALAIAEKYRFFSFGDAMFLTQRSLESEEKHD